MELSEHNGGFSRTDFQLGKSFGARNGYGISLIGKIPLHKKGHFWLDIISSFNRFQSDLISKNNDQGKVAYNVFSGGVGIDYNFTPTHRVKYFLGEIHSSVRFQERLSYFYPTLPQNTI